MALLACTTAAAQVTVDKPIILVGADDGARQVTGLNITQSPAAPLTATVEQDGQHRSADAVMGSTWQIDLPALNGAPSAGTTIVVQVPSDPGSGPFEMLVNGSGPYPLLASPSTIFEMPVPHLPMLSMVFDGSAFQVLNGRARQRRPCPTGMVAVNDQYCVDILESDTTDFFTAGRSCVGQDKRLCTWGEWYGACQLGATIGMLNTTGNWEWTDDSANEDQCVRIVGYTSCSQSGTWGAYNTPQYYRCCYTR